MVLTGDESVLALWRELWSMDDSSYLDVQLDSTPITAVRLTPHRIAQSGINLDGDCLMRPAIFTLWNQAIV